LGNSIVSAGRGGNTTSGGGDKAAKSTQAGQNAYQQAIASGQSETQAQRTAVLAVAEASGASGAVDLTGETASLLTAEQSFNPDEAFRLSNGTDSAIINYGDASNINGTLSAVANFLGSAPAGDLGFRFASQSILGKHGRDAAFASGVARGEASYINGVRNRASVGVDFTQFRQQVAEYSAFRQGQRSAFQAEYNGYNGFQKFGFNTGVSLFSGLINGGEAIGNLTAFTGIQGSTAAGNAYSSLADGAVDTFNFAFNTSGAEKFSAISNYASGVYASLCRYL
jgi:hypothetical protein